MKLQWKYNASTRDKNVAQGADDSQRKARVNGGPLEGGFRRTAQISRNVRATLPRPVGPKASFEADEQLKIMTLSLYVKQQIR